MGGRLADAFGQRVLALIAAIIFALGIIGAALAPGARVLILFRVMLGLAVGLSSVVVPLYISEISPTNVRSAPMIPRSAGASWTPGRPAPCLSWGVPGGLRRSPETQEMLAQERVCEGLEFLGIRLDPDRNAAHTPVISGDDAAAATVRVVPTDEDLMVAWHTRKLIEQEH